MYIYIYLCVCTYHVHIYPSIHPSIYLCVFFLPSHFRNTWPKRCRSRWQWVARKTSGLVTCIHPQVSTQRCHPHLKPASKMWENTRSKSFNLQQLLWFGCLNRSGGDPRPYLYGLYLNPSQLPSIFQDSSGKSMQPVTSIIVIHVASLSMSGERAGESSHSAGKISGRPNTTAGQFDGICDIPRPTKMC